MAKEFGMTAEQVSTFARTAVYKGIAINGTIEESHISWVVLSRDLAFKIKKPVKLTFADFSSLALRQFYCQQEVKLNSRFTNIYIACEPISSTEQGLQIACPGGHILDYCVVMKRMASDRRMDVMLQRRSVTADLIRKLAGKVAEFHRTATQVFAPFSLERAQETFNDILSVLPFVVKTLGSDYGSLCSSAVDWSNSFLISNAACFQKRIDDGFRRDVHGDLHTHNIFLYPDPVIFDCIEFNDAFRHIDILYEIAFLCMDLEAEGREDYSITFASDYCAQFPLVLTAADRGLFIYFKALRANVRAKIHGIAGIQATSRKDAMEHSRKVAKYLDLLFGYATI